MGRNDLSVFSDPDEVALKAVDMSLAILKEAIGDRGVATVALSGGSTPERMYSLFASEDHRDLLDWSSVLIFMSDERFVPYDDPRSNFGMVTRTLLSGINAPKEHLFPIPVDTADPDSAAKAYEQTLRKSLPGGRFDLVFLGLGDDGHTASLFPGMPSLDVTDRWVVASPPGTLPPPVDRITLTYRILNAARNVCFLVTGEKKITAFKAARDPKADFHKTPAAGIQPKDGNLVWLVDRAAANE